jgi:hypothetical protein
MGKVRNFFKLGSPLWNVTQEFERPTACESQLYILRERSMEVVPEYRSKTQLTHESTCPARSELPVSYPSGK